MLNSSFSRIHYPHISRAVLVWAIGQDVEMASLPVAGHIIMFCIGNLPLLPVTGC